MPGREGDWSLGRGIRGGDPGSRGGGRQRFEKTFQLGGSWLTAGDGEASATSLWSFLPLNQSRTVTGPSEPAERVSYQESESLVLSPTIHKHEIHSLVPRPTLRCPGLGRTLRRLGPLVTLAQTGAQLGAAEEWVRACWRDRGLREQGWVDANGPRGRSGRRRYRSVGAGHAVAPQAGYRCVHTSSATGSRVHAGLSL